MLEGMFGPYQLDTLLGRGGMGEVYRAYDTRRKRVVALKLLAPHRADDPAFVARFRRESELAARLSEPHVIPIHDFGEIDGRLYLDMRLVEGTDLHQLLGEEGRLAPERAVGLVRQVASALDAAHAAGLLHRDVKPSNLMLVKDDEGPDFVYLADFGIVGEVDATDGKKITATGVALGTAAYMAPERFDGAGDHRADVYALGCVLYELLTGKRPYVADSFIATMTMHIRGAVPRPSVDGLPLAFDQVIATALAKTPDRRYPSAGALAAAAQAALTAPEVTEQLTVRERAVAAAPPYRPAPPPVPPPARPPATWPDPAVHAPEPVFPAQSPQPRRRVRRPIVLAASGIVLVAATVTAVVLSSGAPNRPLASTPNPSTTTTQPQPTLPPADPTAPKSDPFATDPTFSSKTIAPPPPARTTQAAPQPQQGAPRPAIAKAELEAEVEKVAAPTFDNQEVHAVCDGDLPPVVGGQQTCLLTIKTEYGPDQQRATLTAVAPAPGQGNFHVAYAPAR
ncbi:serine/threonine-protein kinase [Pseudonocardia sp. TRM90224]|uniref:serine/threonine-protein kinase n=1 Tax=Pseudonocardia sp. TRM90224 TaxID=2812678 RepID=UPI001E3B20AC|nr:serine/threonine-protein kinase [Pseudonocardia sp. TRM90224]